MTTIPLSVQLYTVRDAIASDLETALRRLAEIGFTLVEPWGFVERVDEYAELLPALGLSTPSAHARLVGQELGPIVDAAKRLGIATLIDPHIDDDRWRSREGVEGVAADLNSLAERLADDGLAVGYHNHAFELENLVDGTPALEVLAGSLTDAVALEVDTYWVEVGGQDAPDLLSRLGDRVRFLHVKDGPITKVDSDQVAVGSGSMPIAAILRAAPHALPVVELDGHAGDVFTALADSVDYLETLLG